VTKKPQPNSGTWSVAAGSLTLDGQSELLRQLGSQIRDGYQHLVDEPVPDELKLLLEKLEQASGETDPQDR
jgi:hypothetical protein